MTEGVPSYMSTLACRCEQGLEGDPAVGTMLRLEVAQRPERVTSWWRGHIISITQNSALLSPVVFASRLRGVAPDLMRKDDPGKSAAPLL